MTQSHSNAQQNRKLIKLQKSFYATNGYVVDGRKAMTFDWLIKIGCGVCVAPRALCLFCVMANANMSLLQRFALPRRSSPSAFPPSLHICRLRFCDIIFFFHRIFRRSCFCTFSTNIFVLFCLFFLFTRIWRQCCRWMAWPLGIHTVAMVACWPPVSIGRWPCADFDLHSSGRLCAVHRVTFSGTCWISVKF